MTTDRVAEAPRWFTTAVAELPEYRDVEVADALIRLRCWGRDNTPGVVLVHGGSAHSGWWDHITPLLASSHRRAVALDLSGHGDSGVRSQYPLGHSMGDWVPAAVGARRGPDAAGPVIIDSPLFDDPPEEVIIGQLNRRSRAYPSKAEICSRFRTEPAQDTLLPYVAQHVAKESVRQTEAGRIWKYDPEMFRKPHLIGERVQLRTVLAQWDSGR